MATITTDLGIATAYGYAKSKGYTGTEEQFAELMASYATVAGQAAQSASDAADSATNAHNSEVAAQGYAGTAQTKAGEASNSAQSASGSAGTATNKAAAASADALKAEGFAVGEQNGAAVASGSPYYQNNAEYYRDKAKDAKDAAEAVLQSIPQDYSALSAEVLSMFPTDTATGAVASFSDGADNVPVRDLTVAITPVQSGSGDPAPDNVRPISGWTGAVISACGDNLISHYNEDLPKTQLGVTFSRDGNNYIVNASADKDGYPYVRICQLPCLKAGTYTISSNPVVSGIMPRLVDRTVSPCVAVNGSATFTVAADIDHPVDVEIAVTASMIATGTHTIKCELVIGSAAGNFEPYNGTTIPLSWQSTAGTVYGGTLDATTGVLTVDRAMLDMGAQELVWSKTTNFDSSHWRFYTGSIKTVLAVPESNSIKTSADCSQYSAAAANNAYLNSPNGVFTVDTSGNVSVYDERYNDASDFKTAMSGVQFVYPLATPQVYQLSATEIKTLLGNNNVWADTGDSTVQYRADIQRYIDKKIAAAVAAL